MLLECEVVIEELSDVDCPYDVVIPYSACEVASSLVVHVMVADVVVVATWTCEIVGEVVSMIAGLFTEKEIV